MENQEPIVEKKTTYTPAMKNAIYKHRERTTEMITTKGKEITIPSLAKMRIGNKNLTSDAVKPTASIEKRKEAKIHHAQEEDQEK